MYKGEEMRVLLRESRLAGADEIAGSGSCLRKALKS